MPTSSRRVIPPLTLNYRNQLAMLRDLQFLRQDLFSQPFNHYLCPDFSIYSHSLIYQNNLRLSSGIFLCRRAFFVHFPKWHQLNADFMSMYLISQLNNLTFPLDHIILIPAFCTFGDVIYIVWDTFPHTSFYPQCGLSRRILWGCFFCLSQVWLCFYEHCSYSPW